jgi:PadR family transcriptional regulator PadR
MQDDTMDNNDEVEVTDETKDDESDTSAETEESAEQSNKSTISSDLIRGHINTIILRTLYERDKYGYEIMTEIEHKSHGQYTLKQPTLYSALKRLESQGYIQAYWKTDEVTLGGRRKYFKLTESGKMITEQNLSEWEYSRSVIDSLISDRQFDFTQPAPTPVDFNLLKQSITKVPTFKDENTQQSDTAKQQDVTMPSGLSIGGAPINAQQPQPQQSQQTVSESSSSAKMVFEQADTRSDEEKRTAHENFLKLISSPAQQPTVRGQENTVPNSEDIDTQKLIYNNKPETERDYKNLISGIFNKAIKPTSAKAPNKVQQYQPEQQMVNIQPIDGIYEKSQSDGLKINTLKSSDVRNIKKAVHTTYDLGVTLFKCSLATAIMFVLEFILCMIFKDNLGVNVAYPIVILLLGIAQAGVCGTLALTNYGKNSAKPTTKNYLSITVIMTIIVILIICITAFLLNVNLSSAGQVMAKIVVPCIVALNIPLFAVLFYLFTKD